MNKKVKSFRYIKENLKHVFLIITIREINWLTYRVNDYELNPDSENTIFLINLLNTILSYRILIKNCKIFPLILQQIFTTYSPQNTRVTTRFRSRSPKHLYGIFQFLSTFFPRHFSSSPASRNKNRSVFHIFLHPSPPSPSLRHEDKFENLETLYRSQDHRQID